MHKRSNTPSYAKRASHTTLSYLYHSINYRTFVFNSATSFVSSSICLD